MSNTGSDHIINEQQTNQHRPRSSSLVVEYGPQQKQSSETTGIIKSHRDGTTHRKRSRSFDAVVVVNDNINSNNTTADESLFQNSNNNNITGNLDKENNHDDDDDENDYEISWCSYHDNNETTPTIRQTSSAAQQQQLPLPDRTTYHSATIAVKKRTVTNTNRNNATMMICLKGRGYITNISSNNTDSSSNDSIHHDDHNDDDATTNNKVERRGTVAAAVIELHGYQLHPYNRNKNPNHRNHIHRYYFDSAQWSSWVTLTLQQGQTLRIDSATAEGRCDNDDNYHHHHHNDCYCCSNGIGGTFHNHNDNNSDANMNDIGTNDNIIDLKQQQQQQPWKHGPRTFDIYNVGMKPRGMGQQLPLLRPTIVPTTWCNAVQRIVLDYQTIYCTAGDCIQPDKTSEDEMETNDSMIQSKQTSAYPHQHQHLAYFQESFDHNYEEDGTDDDDDDSNVPTEAIDPTMNNNTDTGNNGYQIMICGAKGVGKSTCLRYCINSLLNVVPTTAGGSGGVMVLDADPGQPEYTTPGMLQLLLVRVPNLIPPHLSQLLCTNSSTTCEPNNMESPVVVIARHYFGSITSSSDPITYIQCIESLLNQYKAYCNNSGNDNYISTTNTTNPSVLSSSSPPPPLVINLDGWTNDFGYEILTTFIQDTFQLQHLIQISGNTVSKLLDVSTIVNNCNNNNNNNNNNATRIQLHRCDAYNMRPTTTTKSSSTTTAKTSSFSTPANGQNRTDSDGLDSQSAFVASETEIDDDNCDDEEVRGTITKEPATADGNDKNLIVPTTSIIPAAILRDIRLVTYFMQVGNIPNTNGGSINYHSRIHQASTIWDTITVSSQQGIDDSTYYMIGNTFAAARPYVISFDAVHVRFTMTEMHNDIVSDEHIMDAINGTLVGLCTIPIEQQQQPIGTSTTSLLHCSGLGLVRAIDRKRRLLFVITPLDIESLQEVNCLAVGSNIHLPVQCYFRGPMAEAFPYLSFTNHDTVPILGREPMKSRNNIGRRGGGGGG